jgi:hypothetical protein
MGDLLDSDASPPTRYNYRRKGSLEIPRIVRSRKSANRYIAFYGPKTQWQAIIHPIFRQYLRSGRAGNIGALDN